MVVNIHDAKTHLSQLVARAEKGESITIARSGKPVAQLVAFKKGAPKRVPTTDPLLNLDSFAVKGPGGKLANRTIDQRLYGRTS